MWLRDPEFFLGSRIPISGIRAQDFPVWVISKNILIKDIPGIGIRVETYRKYQKRSREPEIPAIGIYFWDVRLSRKLAWIC